MTKYTNGANSTAERLSGASDAKYDDGTRYHVIRDGVMRMVVRGSELKATDIVESVDDPDSRTQLVADIQAWLESNVGFSVWLTDVIEQVRGWLDRQAAITEQQTERKWCCYEGSVQAEIDRLQRRNDELRTSYDKLKRERDKLKTYVDDATADYAKLVKERDALADDLAECMEERDYWKQEVQFCMDAAYPPSHAPERPYDPRVMAYPDREGCTTPSTLVSAMIDGLRDDVRDMVMPIVEESANAKADCERWRDACGSMMDVAHEIERIMAEMELR